MSLFDRPWEPYNESWEGVHVQVRADPPLWLAMFRNDHGTHVVIASPVKWTAVLKQRSDVVKSTDALRDPLVALATFYEWAKEFGDGSVE